MSLLETLTLAVVEELNALPLLDGDGKPVLIAARREWVPTFKLQDLQEVTIIAVPSQISGIPDTRAKALREASVDIAVMKRIDESEFPAMLEIMEQIVDHFEARRLATLPEAFCLKADNDPIYVPEHFRQQRQFTSIVKLTFQVKR